VVLALALSFLTSRIKQDAIMNQRDYVRWEKTRSKGRSRFVWLVGVTLWGITTGILWALAMAWIDGFDKLPILLALALFGFPIGGYFFGAWMWNKIEAEYRKALAERRFIYLDREE
jgi:hypothetical protein